MDSFARPVVGQTAEALTPTRRLMRELADTTRSTPVRAVGTVNAIVARVAQEAGAEAMWLSGLELSAAKGLPDTNVLNVSDLVEAVLSLTAVSQLPLVVDIDNAGGSLTAAARYGRELFRAGAAAVSVEDSAYPKCNSFSLHRRQDTADVDLICGQIRTLKETSGDLCVIGRTESLVCGRPMSMALDRGEAFVTAGADAVLIHVKDPTGDQAFELASRWSGAAPLVVVPTAFPQTPPEALAAAGFRLAIYANQLSRVMLASARQAMEDFILHGAFDKSVPMATMADLLRIGDAGASAPV